jgi:hypothetical protein
MLSCQLIFGAVLQVSLLPDFLKIEQFYKWKLAKSIEEI